MFFPTHTHTHTRIHIDIHTYAYVDKMLAYIHEPAVHLHNRWQQAASGDGTWRTLPFILVPGCLPLDCFLGGKFHTHTHKADTHTHTHTNTPTIYIEIWRRKRQTMAMGAQLSPAIFIACKCAKGGAKEAPLPHPPRPFRLPSSVEMADV